MIDGCCYQEKMETQLSLAIVVVGDWIWASHTEDTIVEPIQHSKDSLAFLHYHQKIVTFLQRNAVV